MANGKELFLDVISGALTGAAGKPELSRGSRRRALEEETRKRALPPTQIEQGKLDIQQERNRIFQEAQDLDTEIAKVRKTASKARSKSLLIRAQAALTQAQRKPTGNVLMDQGRIIRAEKQIADLETLAGQEDIDPRKAFGLFRKTKKEIERERTIQDIEREKESAKLALERIRAKLKDQGIERGKLDVIKVRRKSDGVTGSIDRRDFDSNLYENISGVKF